MGESIRGKVVLITGASSGIGAGCAQEFARWGAKLALTGRNRERLEETADSCVKLGLNRDQIFLVVGDLTEDGNCERIVTDSVAYFGGTLDVLVNNAGEASPRTVYNVDVEDLDFCYNILLRSVFVMTKLALPHLRKTKGCIINMSSVSGLRPSIRHVAYSMLKCGLDRFTQILSCSPSVAGKGIRVNSVNPGPILTPILTRPGGFAEGGGDKLEAFLTWVRRNIPAGRVGDIAEVARLVTFLASKDADIINGVLFPIDGSYSNTLYIPKLE